jgi:hypothetical protein
LNHPTRKENNMHAHGLRNLPFGTRSFTALTDHVDKRASLALPDKIVTLDELRYTDLGTVEVPGDGHFELTTWSRRQLASLVGVRCDRWFEQARPAEVAEEMNRRFKRTGLERKLRLSRHDSGSTSFSDGVLRAFLGPKFCPIDDERVFASLKDTVEFDFSETSFVRCTMTECASQRPSSATSASTSSSPTSWRKASSKTA